MTAVRGGSDSASGGPPPVVDLSPEQQAELLEVARSTLESYLSTAGIPDVDVTDPCLSEIHGVFVTLTRDGQLRGCMGSLVGTEPVCSEVQRCAVMAATQDPRFPRVTAAELDRLEIEISVLGPLEPVDDLDDIEVGVDGLLIENGGRRGTLLPQVATEYGWDRTELLAHLCAKAGLPASALATSRLYRYSAQVFSE